MIMHLPAVECILPRKTFLVVIVFLHMMIAGRTTLSFYLYALSLCKKKTLQNECLEPVICWLLSIVCLNWCIINPRTLCNSRVHKDLYLNLMNEFTVISRPYCHHPTACVIIATSVSTNHALMVIAQNPIARLQHCGFAQFCRCHYWINAHK